MQQRRHASHRAQRALGRALPDGRRQRKRRRLVVESFRNQRRVQHGQILALERFFVLRNAERQNQVDLHAQTSVCGARVEGRQRPFSDVRVFGVAQTLKYLGI